MSFDFDYVKVGDVGVDSGQIMVVDPCYVTDGKMYKAICETTLSNDVGEVEGGVATSTTWGDGYYPVFRLMNGSTQVGIAVIYGDDPLEDAFNYDEDEEE
jgi:hypothetical protein